MQEAVVVWATKGSAIATYHAGCRLGVSRVREHYRSIPCGELCQYGSCKVVYFTACHAGSRLGVGYVR